MGRVARLFRGAYSVGMHPKELTWHFPPKAQSTAFATAYASDAEYLYRRLTDRETQRVDVTRISWKELATCSEFEAFEP